jgi:alkylhydroperoxidase family enzyme
VPDGEAYEKSVAAVAESLRQSEIGTKLAELIKRQSDVLQLSPRPRSLLWMSAGRKITLNVFVPLETKYTKVVSTVDISMNPFLSPIEEPAGLMKRLAYYFTRKQFGKVLTPLKVHSARLPTAFGLFYAKIGRLDKKLTLPREMVFLLRERVAQINICSFCMDIGRAFVIKESMNEAKFDALGRYRTSSLFSDAERAALDYVTELTSNKKVNPETFARMAKHYSEREICEIVWLVASEHLYNMTNIGLNIHSDMLCDISRKRKAA